MFKRLSIIVLVFVILSSLLGMFFLHHGAKSDCPFCSRGMYQLAVINGISSDLFASDSIFRFSPVENSPLLQSIILKSYSGRAPPS